MMARLQNAVGVVLPLAMPLALLAACAPDPPDDAEVLASSAELPAPQPGLYRSTTRLTSYDLPLAAPQEAAAMRERMAAVAPSHAEHCLTPEEAAGGWRSLVAALNEGSCHLERFATTDGRLDALVACTAPGPITTRMAVTGTATATSSQMTMRINQQGDAIPGGEQVLEMAVESQRVGDCPAATPSGALPAVEPSGAGG